MPKPTDLSCLFASTSVSRVEILCAANCWTLGHPLPFSIFCTLGFVVISPLLSLFHSSSNEGSVLTLWHWDCKIRMEMCEMHTSVCHLAISTLHCSFLAAIKTPSYAFICWFTFIFIFIFIISWVLECFLKAGRAAEFPPPSFVLSTAAPGLRSVMLEKALSWAPGARAVLLHLVSNGLWSVPRRIPTCCSVGINELWGEQGRTGHALGSSHHPTPCITLWLGPKLQCYPSL